MVLPQRISKAPAQNGQALVEGLVALMVLLSLWVAVSWLARLQDIALQATHASRHAAFVFSRDPHVNVENDIREHFFSGPAHQWSDRSGKRILSEGLVEVELRLDRRSVLPAHAQPGEEGLHAQALRQDWRIEDPGVLAAQITVAPRSIRPLRSEGLSSALSYFDIAYPVLSRHTAILTGAGHAGNDTAAQLAVAGSALGWTNSANPSYALGAKIASVMTPVDSAWNRPEPVLDWLGPWTGRVPELHLGH